MAARSQPMKDHWKEQRLFLSRIVGAAVIVVLLTGVLLWRLFHLQVVEYQHFSKESQDNQIEIQPLAPTRGLVYDREGNVLAENVPTWQLVAVPEQVDDLETELAGLEDLTLLDPVERPVLIDRVRSSRRFDRVMLTNLTEVQAATFAARRHRFPGINIQAGLIRYYPYGEATAHTVGYVGSPSLPDYDQFDRTDYPGTSQIGKTGIERAYEELLHGHAGFRPIVVNAHRRPLLDSVPPGGIETRLPEPGQSVVLSLDMKLQLAAEEALDGVRGAAVAIDPRNGDVLALVSTPAFDPNRFARGMSGAEYSALTTDGDRPLINRALAGGYPPGSTVKPFLGLAGLYYETERVSGPIYCTGEYFLENSSRPYREAGSHPGHGEVDLHSAIVRSCNVFFYGLAVELGIEHIESFMKSFGFGSRTGIDIGGEISGLMPGPEWKRKTATRREDRIWYPGETVSIGIGQGATVVTPLQLANATAAMAMSGTRFEPRLLRAVRDAATGAVEAQDPVALTAVDGIDPADWQTIHDAMHGVTSELHGTGRAPMQGTPYTVAAKTGTAQRVGVAEDERYDADALDERQRDNGLFIAFAPVEDPEIAIAVVVENNGGGSKTAAPVARQVLDAYFGTETDSVAQLITD